GLAAAGASAPAWRGRKGGCLPRGQALEAAVPSADLAVAGQRVAADLRAGQPAPDGEVGQRHRVPDQPVAAVEVVVEDLRHHLELLLAARDLLRVWAAPAEALLHEVLVDQRAAGPLPVRQLPALPAA